MTTRARSRERRVAPAGLGLLVATVAACGGGSEATLDAANDPTAVPFGTTAIVVVVNPVVNDDNRASLPVPGSTRAGVRLTTDDGVTATTDATGIAVLAPVMSGTRTITVAGTDVGGSVTVTIADGELRELALATAPARAEVMVEIDYKNDQVTEVTPTMTPAEVDAALRVSDTVVFFRGGEYPGNIDFSGSRVTLFGEGVLGGQVTLAGNVTMSGSNSRIRGARITGTLTIPASGVGLSFSRVDGAVTSAGSDATFLANALCGADTITGSGTTMVGNTGAAPVTTCP